MHGLEQNRRSKQMSRTLDLQVPGLDRSGAEGRAGGPTGGEDGGTGEATGGVGGDALRPTDGLEDGGLDQGVSDGGLCKGGAQAGQPPAALKSPVDSGVRQAGVVNEAAATTASLRQAQGRAEGAAGGTGAGSDPRQKRPPTNNTGVGDLAAEESALAALLRGSRATLEHSLALLQRSAQTLQQCDSVLHRSALLHFLAKGSREEAPEGEGDDHAAGSEPTQKQGHGDEATPCVDLRVVRRSVEERLNVEM